MTRHGSGSTAIGGGFPVRSSLYAELDGSFFFGDIVSGELWQASLTDLLAADDEDPATVAPFTAVNPPPGPRPSPRPPISQNARYRHSENPLIPLLLRRGRRLSAPVCSIHSCARPSARAISRAAADSATPALLEVLRVAPSLSAGAATTIFPALRLRPPCPERSGREP